MTLLINQEREQEYYKVMEKFLDNKSAEYSIHQISLMGESVDKKPVGTWFGPNTVAQVDISHTAAQLNIGESLT